MVIPLIEIDGRGKFNDLIKGFHEINFIALFLKVYQFNYLII
jgi:hypothetical protein